MRCSRVSARSTSFTLNDTHSLTLSPLPYIRSAINENGLEAAQYQIALNQVEALNNLGAGEGKQTILVPAQAIEAFGDAFKLLKGRG